MFLGAGVRRSSEGSERLRMIRRNLDSAPEMIGMLSDVQPGEVERLRLQLMRVTERLRKKLVEIPAIITDEVLSSDTVSERRASP